MQAHIGDKLMVACAATGATRRDGEIVGLHHEDGTPPYDVRWADTDQIWLFFPGPDTRIRHVDRPPDATSPGAVAAAEV
ncbi:DUF1918 domain-containing protein [Streptomyces sp. A1-5]|uniref:DUF1918 domain-containing protein n=1 Tax=Streptomyces noursei TaxID=1971 RepID=UPI001963E41B|nr:DUF1918 domain-containing protein [Streptomyces noursei]UJB46089.1 DUF1918 domain-containing protein [Streptomyces sp. A1-5]